MTLLRNVIQLCLLFCLCFGPSIAQDSSNVPSSNSVSTSPPPSSTQSRHGSSTGTSNSETKKGDVSTTATRGPSTTTRQQHQQTAPANVPVGAPNHGGQNQTVSDIDLLPIRPEITPAFGVSGFILMASGLVYTLVGVRHRSLSIFLSSGYLVALAVTVLVLYVMDPPISDAIQGAYFVAAFASGCIIGGLSLIFTEVTEGLGGLLGGFCLAMWLLVLKSGGLVTSLGGRIAIIASFSLASFSLTFSKYTRTYGLMFSISFAGATIVVLGIDCYSRAGLKEFWVYIWDLNQNIFPLGTNTYPMTRGIKVEIAGIILLFLCGLLSQWKLYKILKQRKEKKALARAQDDEAREHLEADLGRRIEDTTARERALWERQYGAFTEKSHASAAASAAGSIYPTTTEGNSRVPSVKDMTMTTRQVGSPDADVMEMNNLRPFNRAVGPNENPFTAMVRSIHDEAIPITEAEAAWPLSNTSSNALDRIPEADSRATTPQMQRSSSQTQGLEKVTLQPSAPPPPVVVPLPFTVSERETRQGRDETESLATVGDTAFDEFEKKRKPRASKHIRAVSEAESSEAEPDIVVPHVDDDRASSVAATLDDFTDDEDNLSLPPVSRSTSPTRRSVRQNSKRMPSLRKVGSASDLKQLNQAPSLPDSAVSEVKSKRRLSEPPPTDLVEIVFNEPERKDPEELSNVLNLTTARDAKRKSLESSARTSRSGSRAGGAASTAASLSAVKLMRQPSMAAQKYRTHEWTKYLSDAEQPLPGELDPSEDGVRVERHARESAAPVHVEELQQTATTTINRSESNPGKPIQHKTRLSRSFSDMSSYTPPVPQQNYAPQGHAGQQHQPVRSFSQPSIMTQPGRNFSSPLVSQPLVESPIEDVPDSSTLLGMRESMLRKKASANQLHRPYPTPNPNFTQSAFFPQPSSAFSETSSLRSYAPTGRVDPDNVSLASLKQKMEEDNMPLSRRKTLIQQQQSSRAPSIKRLSGGSNGSQPFHHPQSQAAWPDVSMQPMPSHQSLIYDAHLPQRGPSVDNYTRQARLANFRESLRQGAQPNAAQTAATGSEGHRFQMLTEKRNAEAQLQQKELQKQALDSVVDQGMRNGVMLDLHKERLRRMQSQASQHA